MNVVLGRSSKTTVVNAAFLQEVKESNSQLWSVLHELRALTNDDLAADESAELSAQKFVDGLSQLRDCVGLEFSLEETYGFIEGANVSGTQPSGQPNAARAKAQHRELYLQLQEICEQAEEAQYRGTICEDFPLFMGAFDQFDESFRAHEDLESSLIESGLGVYRIE